MNVANGLDKRKFEPHILCQHEKGDFFATVKASAIPIHVFEYLTPMRPIVNGLAGCWKVSRKFRKIKPDIIHSYHYAADYSEAVAAKMAGCKWVYTKKNMSWGGGSKNAWHLRSYLANHIAMQNSEMLELFFRKNQSKTSLIPRGVDTNRFRNTKTNASEIERRRIVICVANLVPVKGLEVLIEAFKLLCNDSRLSCWQLKVVGENQNEYGKQLERKYAHLISEKKLIFTGKLLDVKGELEASDIFVLPTLHEGRMEGSPVSLLEAMSMGLITLGSKVPGIIDQLRPLNEDYLFDPGNVSMLAEKLRKYMDKTPEARRNLGEKVEAYCRSEWDISNEVKKHEDLYLSIFP